MAVARSSIIPVAEGGHLTDIGFVIAGAGRAGLAAAKRLRPAGLTCHVPEAMDRIGCRARTTTTDVGLPCDSGCARLHAADRNPSSRARRWPGAQADRRGGRLSGETMAGQVASRPARQDHLA